jgi:hypothetical protein
MDSSIAIEYHIVPMKTLYVKTRFAREAIMLCRGALVVILALAAASCSKDAKKSAIEAAEAWLAQVDAGKYGDSWDQAAVLFKSVLTKEQWVVSLNSVRKPLGAVKKREVLKATPMTNPPGAPAGEYLVIQFSTDFANKQGAVETVTPMREEGGDWRVSGYYIK